MSAPAQFAIMRIAKHKTVGAVASLAGHALRDRPTPNADPTLTPNNIVHIGPGLADGSAVAQAVADRVDQATHRRPDSVLCLEVICSVSPDWAAKATPEQWEQWRSGCLTWMREEFGQDNVVFCVEHRDETTPHLSAFVTPIRPDGRLSASHWTGGGSKPGEKLSQMQDRHHEAVRKVGLRRGIRGSRAQHQDVQRFYGAAVNPRVPKVPPVEVPGALDVLTPTKRKKFAEAQTIRVRKPVRAIAQRAGTAEIQRTRAEGAEATARALERQRDQLKAEASRLREVPLTEVLTAFHLAKDDRGSTKTQDQWRDANGAHRITITGGKWFDHDAKKGGGGAIDLVCHLAHCSPKEAIADLAARFGGETAEAAAVARAVEKGRREAQEALKGPPPPFRAPTPFEGSWGRVRRFLTEERRLSPGIVDEAHNRGDLYADERGNAVWLQRDTTGAVVGAEVRGTGATPFQGVSAGSRPGEGMYRFTVGDGGPLILAESAIDTLSLADIRGPKKPGVYASTAGNASAQPEHPVVVAAIEAKVGVHVAPDSDKAGRGYLAGYVKKWGEAIQSALPVLKDWNEVLKAKVRDGWRSAWDVVRGQSDPAPSPSPAPRPGNASTEDE